MFSHNSWAPQNVGKNPPGNCPVCPPPLKPALTVISNIYIIVRKDRRRLILYK